MPWNEDGGAENFGDAGILAPMEAQFGQVRSRERVRDLAEVFTDQREVDAILDQSATPFRELASTLRTQNGPVR